MIESINLSAGRSSLMMTGKLALTRVMLDRERNRHRKFEVATCCVAHSNVSQAACATKRTDRAQPSLRTAGAAKHLIALRQHVDRACPAFRISVLVTLTLPQATRKTHLISYSPMIGLKLARRSHSARTKTRATVSCANAKRRDQDSVLMTATS